VLEFIDSMPIFRTLNQDFFKKWTPEMAYVLGFFTADGNMLQHKNGGCYMEFYSTDRVIIEYVKTVLKSHHKIALRDRSKLNSKWKKAYRLQVGSKVMFNDLLNLGLVPNKSLVLQMPKVPKEFLRHFIRGYFDGDGCAHLGEHWAKDRNKKRWVFNIRFSSGSRDFLQGLWNALKSQNIKGGYLYDKNGRGYELVFSWKKGIALCKLMYDNASSDMYLNRKYEIYQKALEII